MAKPGASVQCCRNKISSSAVRIKPVLMRQHRRFARSTHNFTALLKKVIPLIFRLEWSKKSSWIPCWEFMYWLKALSVHERMILPQHQGSLHSHMNVNKSHRVHESQPETKRFTLLSLVLKGNFVIFKLGHSEAVTSSHLHPALRASSQKLLKSQ